MANDHPIAAMATYEQSLSNTRYWHFDMARKAIDGIRNFSPKNKKFVSYAGSCVCDLFQGESQNPDGKAKIVWKLYGKKLNL